MPRKYFIDSGFQTVSALQDLLEALVPADATMELLSFSIFQSSDESAAEAEKLQVTYKRASGSYTSGSGGGTITPSKLEFGDPAAGITAERNNTTQALAGSGVLDTLCTDVYDVIQGYEWTPIPETRMIFSPSQALVIALEAPTDALTLGFRAIVAEVGG